MERRNKIMISIVLAVSIIVGISWFLNKDAFQLKFGKCLNVALNKEFVLKKGEKACLKTINAKLFLSGFGDNTCPKDFQCIIAGGPYVEYEFWVNGNRYYTETEKFLKRVPLYEVNIFESDYKKYARFLVRRIDQR